MINTQNLAAQLKWMQNELTALKIAHERGLGLVKFYEVEIDIPALAGSGNYTDYAILTITLRPAPGEQTPFFVASPSVVKGWDGGGRAMASFDTDGDAILTMGWSHHDDISAQKILTVTSSQIETAKGVWTV